MVQNPNMMSLQTLKSSMQSVVVDEETHPSQTTPRWKLSTNYGTSTGNIRRSAARWRSFTPDSSSSSSSSEMTSKCQFPKSLSESTSYTSSMICANCGDLGHVYRQCPKPVTSYGIVCFHIDQVTKQPKYLVVQRRDSLAYVEFLRGKYEICNDTYIRHILSLMTPDERIRLLSEDFNKLWKSLWQVSECVRFMREYEISRNKFETILSSGKLRRLIYSTTHRYDNPEWGFPKGRRNIGETDMECAVREFTEESGISQFRIDVLDYLPSFVELFTGSNGMQYCHVYYIAYMNAVHVDEMSWSPNGNREVQQISWLNHSDITNQCIREYQPERRKIFSRIHEVVLKTLNSPRCTGNTVSSEDS